MENQSILSDQKKSMLQECANWARILGIVGLVSVALSILSVLLNSGSVGLGLAGGFVSTLVGASITIASSILLLFFYKHALKGIEAGDSYSLDRAFYNFKWYFALMGIILIVVLSFACLGSLLGGIFAAAS